MLRNVTTRQITVMCRHPRPSRSRKRMTSDNMHMRSINARRRVAGGKSESDIGRNGILCQNPPINDIKTEKIEAELGLYYVVWHFVVDLIFSYDRCWW